MNRQHCLVGKTVQSIWLADDRKALRFVLNDDSEIIARCDGECCSVTWIEDIINPEFAIGKAVMRAEDIELPIDFHTPTKTDNDEDETAYYGFLIETANGRCTIAYRNSSNGYYGGNLVWPDASYYYGGVYKQNVSTGVWKQVA